MQQSVDLHKAAALARVGTLTLELETALTSARSVIDETAGPSPLAAIIEKPDDVGSQQDVVIAADKNDQWEVDKVTPDSDKKSEQFDPADGVPEMHRIFSRVSEEEAEEEVVVEEEEKVGVICKLALQLVDAKWFDYLVIGLIGLNCVFLALEDPTLEEDQKGYFQGVVLPGVELAFAIVFTIELILRCTAHGVPHYLNSGWNRMDAVIVLVSWLSIFGDWMGNLSSLRALRVLRALRMVTQFEGLKLLVETLFQAAPHLGVAGTLYVSIFLVYGSIGLHVWSGAFHNRCYHERLGTMQEYDDSDGICSNELGAFNRCPDDFLCKPYVKNPFYGVTSFDNLGSAALIVFELCALEGWTTLLYMSLDASGAIMAVVAVVFYISAVVIGGFLAGNLFLAVLKNEYSKVQKAHEETKGDEVEVPEEDVEPRGGCCCCPSRDTDEVQALGVSVDEGQQQPDSCGRKLQGYFLAVAEHSLFDRIFMGAILMNTFTLMAEYEGMPSNYADTLEWINFVLTISFIVELVVKMGAYGCGGYFEDSFNRFDFFIVMTSLIELLASGGGGLSALRVLRLGRLIKVARVLRLLRAMRIVRIAKFVEPLRKIMVVVKQTVPMVGWVSAMLVLVVFFFAILGMQFFGGKFDNLGTRPNPDANFDTFWHAAMTVFQVVTLDDWPAVMSEAVHGTSEIAVGYFVTLVIVGYFVVTNLVLAVMLTAFETPVEKLENQEAGIIQAVEAVDPEDAGVGLKMDWELARELSERADGAVESFLMKQLEYAEKAAKTEGHTAEEEAMAAQSLTQWNHYCKVGDYPPFLEPLHRAILSHEPVPDEFRIYEEEEERKEEERKEEEPTKIIVSPVVGDRDLREVDNQLFQVVRDPEGADLTKKSMRRGDLSDTETKDTETKTGDTSGDDDSEKKDDDAGPMEEEDEDEEEESPLGVTCCGRWGVEHPHRILVFQMTHSAWFMNTVLVAILLSCVQLAWETYADSDIEDLILDILDYTLTLLFTVEMVAKMMSNGVLDNDQAYFKSHANCLDFFIVCISWLSIALSSIDLSFLRSMRALRCIRPLRVLSRSKAMLCVVQSLARSMAGIANVCALAGGVLIVFGILGLQLFTGQSNDMCSDEDVSSEADCTGTFTSGGRAVDREWLSTTASFDNIGVAMLTLLEIATLEGWSGYMHFYIKSTGTEATSVFFLVWVVIAAYFILNLFIGIVFQEFMQASEGPSGFSMLTPAQQEWVMCSRTVFAVRVPPPMSVPNNKLQALMQKVVHSKPFEQVIGVMIVANILVLTWHFWPEPTYWVLVLEGFGLFFSIVFFMEAVAKVSGDGFEMYISDGWNRFDLFLVVTSVIEISLGASGMGQDSGGLISVVRVLRIFRVFRMLRLIKNLAPLRKMTSVLLVSLPSIMNVGAVLMLIYFMFGVLGVSFFSNVPQTGDGITRHANFENLGLAMLTLFRISTGEDWHLIMHDCYNEYAAAPLYFVIFLVLVTFVMINVFVACVVDNMKASQGELFPSDMYQIEWSRLDPTGSGWIGADKLKDLLVSLDVPYGVSSDVDPAELLVVMQELNVPSHNGTHHFSEVLYCIVRRTVGTQLPRGQLVDSMSQEMKANFPVSNLDPDTIVTAAQRCATYKVIERLKQRVLLTKLELQQELGGDFNGTWQEEAAAKMLFFIFFMIKHQDCIPSEELAEERKILLDPTIDDQVYIDLMLSRQQARQEEMIMERQEQEMITERLALENTDEAIAIREKQRQVAETSKKLREVKEAKEKELEQKKADKSKKA